MALAGRVKSHRWPGRGFVRSRSPGFRRIGISAFDSGNFNSMVIIMRRELSPTFKRKGIR